MEEYYGAPNDFRNYVMHYGVKGMHWGVRRYQNTDGSLTDAGRKHYGYFGDRRAGGFKEVANKGIDYAKKHPQVAIPIAIYRDMNRICSDIAKQEIPNLTNNVKLTFDIAQQLYADNPRLLK